MQTGSVLSPLQPVCCNGRAGHQWGAAAGRDVLYLHFSKSSWKSVGGADTDLGEGPEVKGKLEWKGWKSF